MPIPTSYSYSFISFIFFLINIFTNILAFSFILPSGYIIFKFFNCFNLGIASCTVTPNVIAYYFKFISHNYHNSFNPMSSLTYAYLSNLNSKFFHATKLYNTLVSLGFNKNIIFYVPLFLSSSFIYYNLYCAFISIFPVLFHFLFLSILHLSIHLSIHTLHNNSGKNLHSSMNQGLSTIPMLLHLSH